MWPRIVSRRGAIEEHFKGRTQIPVGGSWIFIDIFFYDTTNMTPGESVIQDATFLDSALNAHTSLMQYLNSHPGYPGDPDYPLWYDEKKGRKHLNKYTLSRIFKRRSF
jgi:hypothetical protein